MKLEKAIEILEDSREWTCETRMPDIDDALQLGIEALKREVGWRKLCSFMPVHLLPGETKE